MIIKFDPASIRPAKINGQFCIENVYTPDSSQTFSGCVQITGGNRSPPIVYFDDRDLTVPTCGRGTLDLEFDNMCGNSRVEFKCEGLKNAGSAVADPQNVCNDVRDYLNEFAEGMP